jgi:tetratricopeptide (TPR) repeat protein
MPKSLGQICDMNRVWMALLVLCLCAVDVRANPFVCIYGSGKAAIDACTALLEKPKLSAPEVAVLRRSLGKAYFKEKNYEEANRVYGALVASGQSIPADHADFAYSLWWAGDLKRASAEMERAIELAPSNTLKYEYARLLNHAEDFDTSLEVITSLMTAEPRNAWYVQARGQTMMGLTRFAEARSDFMAAIALDNKQSEFWADLAKVHTRLGNNSHALLNFAEAVRLNRRNPDLYTSRARLHADMGDYQKAIADYTTALGYDQDYWTIYDRAHAFINNNDYSQARADIIRAARLGLGLPYQKLLEARILRDEGKSEEAVNALSEALKIDPDTAAVNYWRGRSYQDLGKHAEAIADFKISLKQWPNDSTAWVDLSQSQFDSNLYEDALLSVTQALRFDPTYSYGHELKSRILLATGSWEAAANAADQAIKLTPQRALAHFRKAEALRRGSSPEQALWAIQDYIRLEPELPWGYTERARINLIVGERHTVQQDLIRARRIAPDEIDVDYVMAWYLEDEKRLEDAIKTYDSIVQRTPADPWPHFNKAMVLLDMDKPALALEECGISERKQIQFIEAARCKAFMLNRMDKVHAARSLMQQAYKQGQNRGRAAFDLGYMNLRYGDYDGAITAFEEAIQRKYRSGYSLMYRGDAYAAIGQNRLAERDYQSALKGAGKWLQADLKWRTNRMDGGNSGVKRFDDVYPQSRN